MYDAYLSYILRDKGLNSIYGVLGTRIHDVLEGIINGSAATKDLLPALDEELADLDMLGVEFPKDFKGNNVIRDNWIKDMTHFCKNFIPPKGEFSTEELVIYPLNENRYVQGYIDLIKHNKDGTISIYDWKTSGKFTKDDLLHHGRQLIFYAIAKEAEGFAVKELAWIMLKYCEVSFMGKKRSNSKELSPIVKVVSRRNLISELKSYIETDLISLGYDEVDIECMLFQALEENSFDCLPKEIQERYKVKPYVCKYPLTDELRQECLQYINSTADLFEGLDPTDGNNFPHREFIELTKQGKEKIDTFFCHELCSHRNTCKHIKTFDEFLKMNKETEDEHADLF